MLSVAPTGIRAGNGDVPDFKDILLLPSLTKRGAALSTHSNAEHVTS